jgi:hypothetical protein|tara:strand:- start:9051 stop:9545 length:495 start_codon:yes stop_codon:yes gene_type:complete
VNRVWKKAVLLSVSLSAVCLLAGALTFWFSCPCDRLPGGPLKGQLVSVAIPDWSFANDAPLCQIQVAAIIPWSVNLNCMSEGGQLYLSCARCERKFWSNTALNNTNGYVGISGKVYPVSMARVLDPEILDIAWHSRAQKVGRGNGLPRADHWWSFSLISRPLVK